MVIEVTRQIKRTVERELWARAAGRCQFEGCNNLLFRSSVTQETVNLAQKAHVYAFSEKGPRGWGPYRTGLDKLNDISNLMLMCHGCHKKIDQEGGSQRYPAELLIDWKAQQEKRIEIVTGIASDKQSNIVLYGANIGSEKSPIDFYSCVEALFPQWYPASEKPLVLSMQSELQDKHSQYWATESLHLLKSFQKKIVPIIDSEDCKHFSIFALAPQPLLINLGALLTDKLDVETYQLRREPKGWRWQDMNDDFSYIIHKPDRFDGEPSLIISLSDYVAHDRIKRVLGENTSIWEITIASPHNDFMKSKHQLSLFRKHIRKLMIEIKQMHGEETPLHIFPVMPVSCNIEFGRARMPKADMPWVVYDQNFRSKDFCKAIELNGDLHDER